ncbi:MAG: gamma-glutamylcyclotransferase [Nitrospira sp.]|nr:gamma-glutamylcyclotransferase [bacterium]MBL7049696.1 gamma-glutamylcyclotransferase [Nitrospira sp.]
MYVFGYGSLINIPSAANALKRPLKQMDLVPAFARGYVRCWRGKERLYFESLGREATGVFLDLCPDKNSTVNGVLLEVSLEELTQLGLREKNYQCVDITDAIVDSPDGKIYTFTVKTEHLLMTEDKDVYIPRLYIDMVKEGCRAMGEDFLSDYEVSTAPVKIPVLDNQYSFIDPVQARYI